MTRLGQTIRTIVAAGMFAPVWAAPAGIAAQDTTSAGRVLRSALTVPAPLGSPWALRSTVPRLSVLPESEAEALYRVRSFGSVGPRRRTSAQQERRDGFVAGLVLSGIGGRTAGDMYDRAERLQPPRGDSDLETGFNMGRILALPLRLLRPSWMKVEDKWRRDRRSGGG
jgi:hypothetical protein